MMKRPHRAMGTRSASNSASASGLSTCLVRDTFCRWSSPKPLPAPSPGLSALRSLALTGRGKSRGAEMWRYTQTPRRCDSILRKRCPPDEEGQFFEKNTVYTTRGDFAARPDERCNVCKGHGFLRVGL